VLKAHVDFSKKIREWDGFGVNYVEAAQTRDYAAAPQEYGGFSLLTETQRQEIIALIFGDDGLKPGVVKIFLDSFHQAEPGAGYQINDPRIDLAAYDHETTTHWMRYFVREGLKATRARSGDGRRYRDLDILVTLYGPPAWMTLQRIVRGRDIDPALKTEVAKYLVSWAKFLQEKEGFPVHYVAVHNEGEDWERWPEDGTEGGLHHDYNMYWPPEQVVEFMKLIPPILKANGLDDIAPAPGETTNWYRFSEWGYADALADDAEAVANLGLITSHGFRGSPNPGRWYGDWRSLGTDILRAKRPDLHAWVTSTSWAKMDVLFVNEIYNNIYCAKVNAIIPWACIQRPGKWVGGDPNPGCAFRVYDDGHYEVMPGYYFYKQVSRAGQPGMAVARVVSNNSSINLIAFAGNGSGNPDAFVVINVGDADIALNVKIDGSASTTFTAYRTSPTESYIPLGDFALKDNHIACIAPAASVTTFFGNVSTR
jgi:O-glycosyl hydrolase